MKLTEKKIAELESKGFKRWTKGNIDRLYINAAQLGLDCAYYKTGNISGADFQGAHVSNCEARRMKAAKTYIDVTTGTVHSDNSTLANAAEALAGIGEEADANDEPILLGGPFLSFEISECGHSLDEVIAQVERLYPGWRFSRTEPAHETCLMAVFEKA